MTYLDNLVPWDAVNDGLDWCAQVIGNKLLSLNNRERNRGEVQISDRDLKELCGLKSKSQVTEGKQLLQELGYIEYESKAGQATIYTLHFAKKNGAARGAPRGAPREIPINARARVEIKKGRKEKEINKEKERSEEIAKADTPVAKRLTAPKTNAEILGLKRDETMAQVERQAVEVIAELEPDLSEEEKMAADEAECRAEQLRLIENLRATDPELAAMMMTQYEATLPSETTAQVTTTNEPLTTNDTALTTDDETTPSDKWTLEEPDFSEQKAEYRAELEREGLIDGRVEGKISAADDDAAARTNVGDKSAIRIEHDEGRGHSAGTLSSGGSKPNMRRMRRRMQAKASSFSKPDGEERSVARGMGRLSASAESDNKAADGSVANFTVQVRGQGLAGLRLDDGQSSGSGFSQSIRREAGSVHKRKRRRWQNVFSVVDCEELDPARQGSYLRERAGIDDEVASKVQCRLRGGGITA